MGLFNYVDVPPQKCRRCRKPLYNWQTKDGDLSLSTVPFGSVSNFYVSCDNCRARHEYTLRPRKMTLANYRLKVTKWHS